MNRRELNEILGLSWIRWFVYALSKYVSFVSLCVFR